MLSINKAFCVYMVFVFMPPVEHNGGQDPRWTSVMAESLSADLLALNGLVCLVRFTMVSDGSRNGKACRQSFSIRMAALGYCFWRQI